MKKFLRLLAEDLIEKNIDFSTTAIVFPSKRAGLFFNRELHAVLQKPFWSPNYISIRELLDGEALVCDRFMLNYILYEVYQKHIKGNHPELCESFDRFYFWGEMLLDDFDDLDKNLVEARQLFMNLRDIKAFDQPLDYLNEEQQSLLKKYFSEFRDGESSQMKNIFLDIWQVLGDIYEDFKAELRKRNWAYEGMMARDLVEKYQKEGLGNLPFKTYVFAGFYQLDKSEKELFTLFKNAKKALFYWDYDTSYLNAKQHEAAIFLKQNVVFFGNELQDESEFSHLTQTKKNISFVAAPTENIQARYADLWLKQQALDEQKSAETALILCNEKLLMPVLSAVENLDRANITMGFPISQSPIAAEIESWISEQIFSDQTSLFPSDLLANLKSRIEKSVENFCAEKDSSYANLFIEAAFRVCCQIEVIRDWINEYHPNLGEISLERLLRSVVSSLTVPFRGEPVLGTQIMGLLESRSLDFKNVLLLSVNEGMLPKTGSTASFIPYNMRKVFGMTTLDHKNAVYAYCFFRLLQRAENLCLTYSTATEGMNRGEMSRFMRQLLVEYDLPIKFHQLGTEGPALRRFPDFSLHLREPLESEGKQNFSPSRLNTFLNCKRKYYLKYIAKLKPSAQESENEAAIFGQWFHQTAELLYLNNERQAEVNLAELADKAYLLLYEKRNKKRLKSLEYKGEELIQKELLMHYIKRLIAIDKQWESFSIIGLEEKLSIEIKVDNHLVKIEGIADRIDRVNGSIRVVDYKTGGMQKGVSMESLFEPNMKREAYNFQAFLYAWILGKTSFQKEPIQPCILYINNGFSSQYNAGLRLLNEQKKSVVIDDFRQYSDDFEQRLTACISEILNPETRFDPTDFPDNCKYCDYLGICNR